MMSLFQWENWKVCSHDMYNNRGEDPQWDRTEYLSVRKNGRGTERLHVDIPWTCCSSAGGLNVEWAFFFPEVPPFWTVQWSAWNGKALSQQVLGSHSDWGSWRKAMALRALWVPGEALRIRASGHFLLPGTKPSAASFGFSSGSLPLTHCLFDNHTVPCWDLCFSWAYPPLSTGSLRASAFKSIMLQRWWLFFSPSCPLYLSLSACVSIVANVVLEQFLWLLLNGIHSTLYESKSVPSSVMVSVFRWLVRTLNYLEASGSRSALQAGFISGLWFASAFIWLCKVLQPIELWVWGPLVSFAT